VLALAGGRAAAADACSDCGPPTTEDLEQDPRFKLEWRTLAGKTERDYVATDGGECELDVHGYPDVRQTSAWLVLRGSGEVWNCPHSHSCDTMVATIDEGDLTSWTLQAEVGASAGLFGFGLSAKLAATVARQVQIRVVTTVSKELCAQECHRVRWWGYFLLSTYEATVDYSIRRRFAWWTKNPLTGHVVHNQGQVYADCGAGEATYGIQAPIQGHFRLQQSSCSDEECGHVASMDLGFFPPVPPGVTPPPPPEPPPGVVPGPGPGPGNGTGAGGRAGGGTIDVDEDDPFDSGDLGDPPTGPLPIPPGFEIDEEGRP
jgi:hypothetical protein